ncbi:hypothetical protein Tco_1238879 [Tanacetum coccineum]
MRGISSFSGFSSVAMPLPLLSSLGGVGEKTDEVVWNRLSVNCSRDMFCGKIVLRGFGDEMIGFGIRNFSLLEGGSSSKIFSFESFSFEAWTTRAIDSVVAPPKLDPGFEVEHLPFHHSLVDAPLKYLGQWYLDLCSPFPISPHWH